MTGIDELIDWLNRVKKNLPNASDVAIDDGGLTLVVFDDEGEELDAYWEVGGISDEDDEDDDDEEET